MGDLVGPDGFNGVLGDLQDTPLPVVTVGDTTTLNCVNAGLIPDLSIIDLGTRRGTLPPDDARQMLQFIEVGDTITVVNPSEEITKELWDAIHDFYSGFYSRIPAAGCWNRISRAGAGPLSGPDTVPSLARETTCDPVFSKTGPFTSTDPSPGTGQNFSPASNPPPGTEPPLPCHPPTPISTSSRSSREGNVSQPGSGRKKGGRGPEDPEDGERGEKGPAVFSHEKFKISRPDRMSATPKIIRIEGEEDLASLPCIHFATRGGYVLYGLPDQGLIYIQVSEDFREIVRNALITMEASYEHIDNESNR